MTTPIDPLHLASLMHDEIRRRMQSFGFDDLTISYREHWSSAPRELRKLLVDAAEITLRKLTDCDMTHEDLWLPTDDE